MTTEDFRKQFCIDSIWALFEKTTERFEVENLISLSRQMGLDIEGELIKAWENFCDDVINKINDENY